MESKGRICSVFGHRYIDANDKLIARTEVEIKKALDMGVDTFLFGACGEFDELCFDIATALKNKGAFLKRVLCVPQYKNLRKPPW